ncbi:DUF6338 family protein [Halorubrum ezzemoulense]|uniref:DUF6338 family protein n=1 Tax=Halorubrum ezzemoulense TaxID=337243 RepID=UPI00117BA905|nr:DUF6338 family protein [Halorubrum ezzemoulense]
MMRTTAHGPEEILFLIQSVGIPGFRPDPILILFIILPGLVFTKSYVYGLRKSDTLDRWDKIGFVLGGSIISGVFFLFFFQAYNENVLITVSELGRRPLLELLYAIVLQSGSAAFTGFVIGDVHRRTDSQTYRTLKDREDPWDYTITEVRDEFVLVETSDGEEVEGIVARYESGNGDDDILISRVAPADERELPNLSQSNAVFLKGEEISKIHFRDDDPSGTDFDWPEGDSDFGDEELEEVREEESKIEKEGDSEDPDE